MISLRGRGTSNRPFIVVEELQKNAELAFREKELSLQQDLEETEKNLQNIKNNSANDGNFNSQQSEAIKSFNKRISKIRKELRLVQRELNQDIKNLETNLKLINIWLMPFLVFALFISIRFYEIKKRKTFNNKIGRGNRWRNLISLY